MLSANEYRYIICEHIIMANETLAHDLDSKLILPPTIYGDMPNPDHILRDVISAPDIAKPMNIFPIEWNHKTPRLLEIYDQCRDPG
jgi:hypothetical protein